MEQGTLIYVEENDKSEARVLAQNFAKNDVKSRAYVNALGAELGMKYLSLENINNQRLYNMHSVRKVLEEFDISDIMLANIHIDVRVVFDENYIFVPKSHFEYDILPDIYNLILERFMLAFAPVHVYEKQTAKLSVGNYQFKVEGHKVIDEGWQKFRRFTRLLKEKDADSEEVQILDFIDWNNLTLGSVDSVQKSTKPPKHFNEASILAFMENPKGESEDKKLAGLGTPATRHTFIPKLLRLNYIEIQKKNIQVTKNGEKLLHLVKETPLSAIADVCETTRWEEKLSQNPSEFENEIKEFVRSSIKGGQNA